MWPFSTSKRYQNNPGFELFRPSPEVKVSVDADGVAFLNIATGAVLSANRVRASIWQAAAAGKGLEGIAAETRREFAVPEPVIRRDAERFLGELADAGLLIREGR
jgi:hypothetical protein